MAVLSEGERVSLWKAFMQDSNGSLSLTKQELRAEINALDQWFDSNAATLNSAFSPKGRTSLSPKQKAFLLSLVLLNRFKAV